MIKLENTVTPSPEQWRMIIMGMRNPMNSWEKSDSVLCTEKLGGMTLDEIDEQCGKCPKTGCCDITDDKPHYIIGPNDHELMMKLAKGGPVHAKYRRMIIVYVDITAPLYWWKEFDTYKVGTVANSCSTMHKIHAKEFETSDFSYEHLSVEQEHINSYFDDLPGYDISSAEILLGIKNYLNYLRDRYLETKDKKYWYQMIQLLPSSYNQKRTVMMSYEVLHGIYKSRKNHKLDEWRELCKWIEGLPYSEIITLEEKGDEHE